MGVRLTPCLFLFAIMSASTDPTVDDDLDIHIPPPPPPDLFTADSLSPSLPTMPPKGKAKPAAPAAAAAAPAVQVEDLFSAIYRHIQALEYEQAAKVADQGTAGCAAAGGCFFFSLLLGLDSITYFRVVLILASIFHFLI